MAPLLAFGSLAGFVLVRSLVAADRDCRELAHLSDLAPESVSYLPCANVYLVHGEGQTVMVFLAESPGRPGASLSYDPVRHQFLDHEGERFDVYGTPVAGARSRLFRCPVEIQDGAVQIDAPASTASAIAAACHGPGGGPSP